MESDGSIERRFDERAPGAEATPRASDRPARRTAASLGGADEPRSVGGPQLPRLDFARRPGGRIDVVGSDPGAPRPLTLFRIDPDSGRGVAVASGDSVAGGRFAFAEVAVPHSGGQFVVAPRGLGLAAEGRSLGLAVPARPPEAPAAFVESVGDAAWQVRVDAPLRGATLVWVDADGRERGRHDIAHVRQRRGVAGGDAVLLTLDPPPADEPLWIAQQLASGVRSDWTPLVEPGRVADSAVPAFQDPIESHLEDPS